MKRVFKIFAALLAVIFVAYFFLIDIAVKAMLEREGSRLLQARLEFSSVSFHLLPASLTLHGVQATNPRQPLRNLLEAESIELPLSLAALREKKLIVDTMSASGVRFNRPRANSGAIAGLTPDIADAAAGQQTLPDAQRQRSDHIAQLRAELQRTLQDLQALQLQWQQRLRALPDTAQLDDYRARAQTRNAASLAQLHAEIRDALGGAGQLQAQFVDDLRRVQEQLAYAQGLPQQGFNNAATGTGNSAGNSPTGTLLLGELKPLFDQILALMAAGPATAANEAGWQWLLRRVSVTGQFDIGAQPLRFAGEIENLTGQPRLFDVVTQFSLQGVADQPGRFSATGHSDRRKTPTETVRFDLDGFPVAALVLSSADPLAITVTKALTDARGLLTLTGNQIDINLLVQFQDAELAVEPRSEDAMVAAATAILRNTRAFDLNLQASGDVREPRLALNSSLDAPLADAFHRYLQSAGAAAAPRELQTELDALRQLNGQFQAQQQRLIETQAALQNLNGL